MTKTAEPYSTVCAPPPIDDGAKLQKGRAPDLQQENRTLREGDQLLRLHQIIDRNGRGLLPFSRSTFYEKIKTGELPKGIKLSERVSCWRKSDILAFIEKMAAHNDS